MSQPRDFDAEITTAIAAGDAKTLGQITLALVRQLAQAEARIDELRQADEQRREKQNRRKRRSRGADVTESHGTERDVTGQGVTSQPTPSLLPSLLSPTPPYNSSFLPPPQSASATGEVGDETLKSLVGDAGWPDVERFIAARRADKRGEWRREMAKIIGPGSQFSGADLAGACSDAMIVDLDGPHALRAFVAKRRDERLNPPAERKPSGQRRGDTGSENFAERRAAEEREKQQERQRAERGRQYDAARAKAVDEWAKTNKSEYRKIVDNLKSVVTFGSESPAFMAVVRSKVADVIGFPVEERWSPGMQWPNEALLRQLRQLRDYEAAEAGKAIDPYADPANDAAAHEAAEQRQIASEYHEQLDVHVERWRRSHETEYQRHADEVYSQFGYDRRKSLTAEQQTAVNNAINLRIRDEQGWSTQPQWVEKEHGRRRRAAVAS